MFLQFLLGNDKNVSKEFILRLSWFGIFCDLKVDNSNDIQIIIYIITTDFKSLIMLLINLSTLLLYLNIIDIEINLVLRYTVSKVDL